MQKLTDPKHAFDLRHQKKVAAIIRAFQNIQLTDANGNLIGRVLYADGNIVFQMNASGGGGAVKMFKITEIPDGMKDYFIAREWSGPAGGIGALGSVDIAIAKHTDQRPSIVKRTIFGGSVLVSMDFRYTSDNHRTTTIVSDNPVTQTETVIMPYQVDDDHDPDAESGYPIIGVVFASKSENGTGVFDGSGQPVDWIDLTPRQWARYT